MGVKSMDFADDNSTPPWTLNSADESEITNSETYANFVTTIENEIRKNLLSNRPQANSFYAKIAFDLHFITYDGRSDLYWSLGDASISSYGSVCSSGGSVSYKAEMTLTKTYSFGNKGTYASRTPTAMGYRLQTHGWLRPYQIEGSWAQTFNFSD
jgi:hypothetical protein